MLTVMGVRPPRVVGKKTRGCFKIRAFISLRIIFISNPA
jgi:hypothetical protein